MHKCQAAAQPFPQDILLSTGLFLKQHHLSSYDQPLLLNQEATIYHRNCKSAKKSRMGERVSIDPNSSAIWIY